MRITGARLVSLRPAAVAVVASLALLGWSAQSRAADRHYVNPFAHGSWGLARTDMGVDYLPNHREAVVAIGRAEVLGSLSHTGWPGGHIIWYQLLNGDHAGNIIYVAEHLKRMVRPGTVVHAGQRIATALPGYPWTEWGWANQYGSPRAAPCYKEGRQTNSGREMARFLRSLGADTLDRPGPGPNRPKGRRC